MSAGWTNEEIERGRLLFSGPVDFLLGVAKLDQLPEVESAEVGFAGRSNAGKSSLINAITGRKDLARASNTPGRTRELNFFNAGGRLMMVDMPGYGYAKAPKSDVKQWQSLLRAYLRGRPGLTRAFVLVDARHGVKSADEEMLSLLDETAVTYQFVLTKIDKVRPSERPAVIAGVEAVARKRPAAHPIVHATSSITGEGIPELRAELAALARANPDL
ncbi:MAG: ribosome biogenesis GTP-binding protein YihA/YsxC [Hyphomicrobiales bacterium]